jgi:acyl dehydratase
MASSARNSAAGSAAAPGPLGLGRQRHRPRAISGITTLSRKDRLLAARITGPVRGTWSRPSTTGRRHGGHPAPTRLDGLECLDADMTRVLGDADFAAPIGDRYFEDYKPGAIYEYGHRTVTEDEIVEFARRYDPQLIHIDAGWAATGPFGTLIASGWHTTSMFTRMFVDHYLSHVASLVSPGVDELRWVVPVRPGDTLRMRVTILETRRSQSRPDRGIVRTLGELINQDDQVALHQIPLNFIRCRG